MAAGLMSCNKEVLNTPDDNTQNEGVPMTFNVTVLETKAAKTAWANGDKIYVFFKGMATKYLVLTYDSGSWSNTTDPGVEAFVAGDFTPYAVSGDKKLTAVHFPVAIDVAYADGKFSFTSGGMPVYNYYVFETGKDYTVDATTVTATLSLDKPAGMVQIHVAGIQDNVAEYTFGCSKIKPVACASVGTNGAITEKELQAGARLSGFKDSDGGVFAGRLTTAGPADFKFTLASDTQIYTLTRTGKTLTAGKMFNFPALSVTGGSNWAVTDASDLYVDLGLPSGTKWAKCNLGAATETDYGDYFAWGETTGTNEGKTNFANWSNYHFGSSPFTKYTGSDYLTLEKEDDAAYAALGGKFRMPTGTEWTELRDNCTCVWTTQSGINGRLFTSKKAGYTDKSIFIPAAGYFTSSAQTVGSNGYFWSSSLRGSTYSQYGRTEEFNSGSDSYGNEFRYYGFSVRPVSD